MSSKTITATGLELAQAPAAPAPAAWDPEDPAFWQETGAALARRTLWISTAGLTLSFATWFVWSAVVVRLPDLGFSLTVSQRFMLTALPGFVGATLRVPYSFIIQMFGTRRVVALATASLVVPAVGIGLAVQDPHTPYWVLLLLAGSAGFGGGNFSAFMSSTSLFYPRAKQGTALGIQAGIGNFGVSMVQFLTPLVIGAGIFGPLGGKALIWNKAGVERQVWIQNAAYFWVIPVVVVALLAAVYLRSIPVSASFGDQAVIFRRKHTWVMTSLYFMTFGSFSGLAASFALLINEVFGKLPGAPDPLRYAFLGALIGSATRPLGGFISDKVGGAKVTMAAGAVMIAASLAVTRFTGGGSMSDFGPFFAMMLLLFLASGVGNGSTFRMIPVIFPRKEAAPVLGWTAAIAAYGFFFVPKLFGWALERFGSPNAAFGIFAAFYAVNLILCWWYYAREGAEVVC
jgi:NNP family nitrate/nitrite transporter-like MFS transporter